jgi:hypothetical protein
MRRLPIDAGGRLAAAVLAHGNASGCGLRLLGHSVTDWSSSTITGEHHRLTFIAATPAHLAGWAATLVEADLPGGRMILADLTPTVSGDNVAVEALLLHRA